MPRASRAPRDPYARARSEALSEPLLPRWFVVLAAALVPVAVVVFVVAFPFFGGEDAVAVAERRPPPAEEALTHDVGEIELGATDPRPARAGCSAVDGFAVAGTDQDRVRLETAVDVFCDTGLPEGVGPAFAALRDAGATVRFALFELSGVDSTVDLDADAPVVLINARFAHVAEPRWVAPLLIHDAVTVAGEPGTVDTALSARRAELAVCDDLFDRDDFSQGCETAEELLALADPAAALREAGYE